MEIDEQPGKYKIDTKGMISANGFKIAVSIAGMLILVMYIKIFEKMINQFQLPEMQVIAIFVFAYSTMKWIFAVMPDITVVYKIREEYVEQEPTDK